MHADIHMDTGHESDHTNDDATLPDGSGTEPDMSTTQCANSSHQSVTDFPAEIIHHIVSYLDIGGLIAITRTSRALKKFADEDLLWINFLRRYLPDRDFPYDSPFPAISYRQLYISHHPYWFLPKWKIWMSDEPLVGKLILCKFDPRRGCIEGYRLLADRGPTAQLNWAYKPSVSIHTFIPRVHIWLDDPVLNLPHHITPASHGRQNWWANEIGMTVGRSGHNTPASFFLARDIPYQYLSPSIDLWPPRTIPDMPRVRTSSQNAFTGQEHKPQKYEQISQTTFRTRHWSQFYNGITHIGVRLGEGVTTWSTLDPSLYTPTKQKPYQGIFVGDYAGHGCEFLLVLQTDKAPPRPHNDRPSNYIQAILQAMEDEIDESSKNGPDMNIHNQVVEPNLNDDLAHVGAIEAIKLTGDPNIPRGEHTFIADDIGPRGLIRIAAEEPFRGARVVHSRGHVAARGFQRDEFIPSQLLLINPDRLAQYWVPFGHISFYERIDIDALLAGTTYRRKSDSASGSSS